MRSLALATLLAALVAPTSAIIVRDENAPPVNANNPTRHRLKRAVTADTSQVNGKAFDFVIAGGGVGGLAIAARLAEWKNVTVCVIEAGGSGDDVQQQIDVPGMAYGNSLTKGATDWGYRTVEQPNAGSVTKVWPRGKLLGGSGAVNGLFWGRASSGEYDAWASLNSGNAHNITWDWAEVNKYIKKSETLKTLPPQAQMDQFHIEVDPSLHGTDGPIHLGWSNYMYPMIENWVPTWESMGLKNKDHAGGDVNGVTITPSTMFQENQTRCDSMAGYIDPVGDLPNLVILTGQQVTSVVFNGSTDADGNNIASGVTFAAYSGAETFSVQANKEVILSGGTVGSAQILQLSGIGPQSVLEQAGVKVIKDLPVGYNLQDHVSNTMYFNTQESPNWASFWSNEGARNEALQEWQSSKTGLYTYINEAVGYVSMSDISGSQAEATSTANGLDLTAILKQVSDAHNIPANVQKGIAAQYELQKQWLTDSTGQLEIILTMWGQSANNNVGVQLGLQHPFSRGTIFISSNDPFTAPTINPDYFSVDIDKQVFNLGAGWIRRMMGSKPMSNNVTGEAGATAGKTGSELTDILVQGAGTEYHPQGTCSMMPEDQGGVVDTRLIVYGTSNIRVVDSSVIPIEISAHLMASTYGIAEKAADLIKQTYQKPPPPPESSTVASSTDDVASIGEATDSAVAGAQKAGSGSGSSLSSQAKIGIGVGVGVGAGALLGALAFFFCLRRKSRSPSDEKGWYAAGTQNDASAWDTQQAYREQESYSMGGMAAPRPNRFSSAHASISTMATADLQNGHRDDSSYSLGDYARGGAASPYRDTPSPNPGYSTPNFQSR